MAASNITLVSRTGVGWFSDFPLEMLPFISGRMEGAAKIIVLDPDSSIFYNDTFRYFQPVSKEKNIEGAWAVENNQRQAVVKRFLENVNGANVGVLNETLNTIWLIECAGGNKIVYVELGGNKQYQEGVYRKLAPTPEDKDLSKPLANHILQINELWERADKNKYPCRN